MTLTEVPCITTPQGLDSEPPCTGQPAGSLVAAFPFAKCQGAFVAADRAPSELFQEVSSNTAYAALYAIYRTEASYYATGFFAPAAAEAVAVFTGVGDVLNTNAWALLLHDGHIVGFDGGCNEKLADFISTRKLTTLVEPPAIRHTTLPDVDAVIDAAQSGDPVQLRPLLAFQPMACSATPQGIGPFYCNEGEKDGTVVDVLPTAQCEGSFLRADEMDRLTFVTSPSFELFAVYRSGQDYTAVFRRTVAQRQAPEVLALQIENGHIASISFGCGETAREYVERVQPQDFVLPPP
jgi:hypothetical protein